MPNPGDQIPAIETYRNVRIHNEQPLERIEHVVKPQLDKILASDDLQALFAVCQDITWSPEARLLARSKLLAALEAAANNRMPKPPGITVEAVRAQTAGLDSVTYRDRHYYCTTLEIWRWGMPVQHRPADFKMPVKREVPLTD
jgi:hypothetical protein